MSIEEQVKQIIANVLNISPSEIANDSILGELPNCDSLNHLKIISAIEKEFSFKFTLDVLMDIEDVSDLIEVVRNK